MYVELKNINKTFGDYKASPRAVVKLQVAAARGVNLLDECQVGGDDVIF